MLVWHGENLSKDEVAERRRHLKWAMHNGWVKYDLANAPRLTDAGDRAANPTAAEAAARRLLAEAARWRAEVAARPGTANSVQRSNAHSGSIIRINPGPRLLAADLDMVASVGAVGASMVERLRAWSDADHAEERGPADALGFLRTLADHGEALALERWPAPAIPARDPAARPGLDALRATHPELLAKSGPCAVLRVLLADPAMLWSVRALAASTDLREALPAGKADPRSVGRWMAELHGAGLACPAGKGTAKRWRMGAA